MALAELLFAKYDLGESLKSQSRRMDDEIADYPAN
jgi:hypothetical protein